MQHLTLGICQSIPNDSTDGLVALHTYYQLKGQSFGTRDPGAPFINITLEMHSCFCSCSFTEAAAPCSLVLLHSFSWMPCSALGPWS